VKEVLAMMSVWQLGGKLGAKKTIEKVRQRKNWLQF
jgi:hypothetical protein